MNIPEHTTVPIGAATYDETLVPLRRGVFGMIWRRKGILVVCVITGMALEKDIQCYRGLSVQDEPHRPFFVVLGHEHDALGEVGVQQVGRRYQQSPDRRC